MHCTATNIRMHIVRKEREREREREREKESIRVMERKMSNRVWMSDLSYNHI